MAADATSIAADVPPTKKDVAKSAIIRYPLARQSYIASITDLGVDSRRPRPLTIHGLRLCSLSPGHPLKRIGPA